MKVADFTSIREWTVENHKSEHLQDVEWLQRQIQDISEDYNRDLIVVTHHAPSFTNTTSPNFLSPTLELHVSEASTGKWIKDKLLRGYIQYEDCGSVQQCPVGILLHVQEEKADPHHSLNPGQQQKPSHILVYGLLSPKKQAQAPSRLTSSTTVTDSATTLDINFRKQIEKPALKLKIYAAPISSDIIKDVQSLPSPPLSPNYQTSKIAEHGYSTDYLVDVGPTSPKRKRVSTLFEAAAEYHRDVRRKGAAAAVSKFVTNDKPAGIQFPLPPSILKARKDHVAVSIRRRALSIPRDSATTSRPHTSRNSPTPHLNANSVKSRSSSTSNLTDSPVANAELSSVTPTSLLQEIEHPPKKSVNDIVAANKYLMARTILTCLRLYGFHRTNKRSASSPPAPLDPVLPSTPKRPLQTPGFNDTLLMSASINPSEMCNVLKEQYPTPIAAVDKKQDDDIEFKEMYHATYRASQFALRKFLRTPIENPTQSSKNKLGMPTLSRDKATEVIDSVLKLFCESEGTE
ncbi:hypothetical protein FQN57_001224 [Myotisia sp. PD_48]|nr:hypothetical protein FQN57_001224 [Myotisia sp. PD_48]